MPIKDGVISWVFKSEKKRNIQIKNEKTKNYMWSLKPTFISMATLSVWRWCVRLRSLRHRCMVICFDPTVRSTLEARPVNAIAIETRLFLMVTHHRVRFFVWAVDQIALAWVILRQNHLVGWSFARTRTHLTGYKYRCFAILVLANLRKLYFICSWFQNQRQARCYSIEKVLQIWSSAVSIR